MRFTLADLKKTIARRQGGRQGEPRLVPFLLRPGELDEQLAALIALFEAHVGRERVAFAEDRPAELIGDYRLARCLVLCLSEWYEWRAPEWPEGATDAEAAALAARGIDSPSALRLALYDHVNAAAGGFLAGDERDTVLDALAASLGLARSTLDDLLRLDAAPQMALARSAAAAPPPAELAARYNQRAVETILANAAVVEWTISPERDEHAEPLGTLVKRACFLARRMGVQYEVSFEPAAPDAPDERPLARVAERPAIYAVPPHVLHADVPHMETPATLDAAFDGAAQPLLLTLYGPQELTGAPTQYGERLARLCRALLGYRRDTATRTHATFAGGGLHGAARVYLHGRPLTFALDDRLLRLLDAPHPSGSPLPAGKGAGGADPYDSSLERQLADEWASLEREHATAGWRLEREPAPIVIGATILVPDFALRRGERRIFLEIAGYWRPEYRERKLRKLLALDGAVPLILAAPEAARADFAALVGRLPALWYRGYLSAPALLALLERDFNDFEARLAQLDLAGVRSEVAARGRIPPLASYALLRCHTRAELAIAVARLGFDVGSDAPAAQAPRWIGGVGLCAPAWRDELLESLRNRLANAPESRMPLPVLADDLRAQRPDLAELADDVVEALARLAGLDVARTSLFAAQVSLAEDVAEDVSEGGSREDPRAVPPGGTGGPAGGNPGGPKSQPRRAAKRKLTEPGYSTTSMFGPDGRQSEDGHPRHEGDTRGRRRQSDHSRHRVASDAGPDARDH